MPFPATPGRPLGDVQLCPQALPAHRYLPQLGGELMETDSSLSTPGKLIPFGERELPEFHTTDTNPHPRAHAVGSPQKGAGLSCCALPAAQLQVSVLFFFPMKFTTDDTFCETPVLKSPELHKDLFERKADS